MQRFLVLWRSYDYIEFWTSPDYTKISVPEMTKTWQFIEEYDFRFLAKPKAHHDFTIEHFVLWEKDRNDSNWKYQELYSLIEKFSQSNYTCWRNSVSMQTVPWLVHYHIAKFKNIDKEVIKSLL